MDLLKLFTELLPVVAFAMTAGTARVFFDHRERDISSFLRSGIIGVFAAVLIYFGLRAEGLFETNPYAQLWIIGAVAFCADDVLIFVTKLMHNPGEFLEWWQSKGKKD